MNRPVPMSQQDLAATLQDMLDRVRAGDSLEGSIEYALPYIGDPEDAYAMVRAAYRVGNLDGQGGMQIIGDTVPAEPPPPSPWEVRAAATGGGPCTCGRPFWTHVCLGCSPDYQTPGLGCVNCRNTGMDQAPCKPAEVTR